MSLRDPNPMGGTGSPGRDDLLGRSLLVHGKGGTDRLFRSPTDSTPPSATAHHITGYLFPGESNGDIGFNS